jgi:hypothetical protein
MVTQNEKENQMKTEWPLSPSETLYSFMGWLTTRETTLSLGAEHDAAAAADVVAEFCEKSGLPEPRDGWERLLALTPSMGLSRS